jgi:hypothetical protein
MTLRIAPERASQEELPMDEAQVFVLADRALGRVVARIQPPQWDMALPPGFARSSPRHRADAA